MVCGAGLPACHYEFDCGRGAWNRARERARRLDISMGDIPGLYPSKWNVRNDELIFYHYDYRKSTIVAFFMYSVGKVHIGVFDTKDDTYHSVSASQLSSLMVVLLSELAGAMRAKYTVPVPDEAPLNTGGG